MGPLFDMGNSIFEASEDQKQGKSSILAAENHRDVRIKKQYLWRTNDVSVLPLDAMISTESYLHERRPYQLLRGQSSGEKLKRAWLRSG